MTELLQTAGMMPHGYCLLWKTWLVALHAGSDLVIFASYFIIPIAILRVLRARPDVQLGGIEYLFAAFILLCGLTHLVGFITLWLPIYEVQGVVKLMTGIVSATTAALAFPMVPKLIALPSPTQLQTANAELEAEIASHRETLTELNLIRARLEAEVENRTRELTEANQRLTLVTRETVHRSKNLLTVVQSIARQSAEFADDKKELVETLSGRMTSLARALSTVIESGSANATLGEVIETQLAHYRDSFPDRLTLEGPALPIRAEAAQQIGLAMHELATNAVKYGALARAGGVVEVRWDRRGEGDEATVELQWIEHGAPRNDKKTGQEGSGFGSLLLKRAVPMQLRAEMRSSFTDDGYRYALTIPATALAPRGQADSDEQLARAFPTSGGEQPGARQS